MSTMKSFITTLDLVMQDKVEPETVVEEDEIEETLTINEDGEESTRILIEDLEDALIEHRKNLQHYQSEIDFWTERFNSLTEDGN